VFIVFATLYSLYAPTFEGPDEQSHYDFSKYILDHPGNVLEMDIHGGPLYYVINYGIHHLINIPESNTIQRNSGFNFGSEPNRYEHGYEEQFPFTGIAAAVHILRFESIAYGVITLIFIYKISRLVAPEDRWFAIFTIAIASLIPKFIWMNSVVNSNSLVFLLVTLTIFYLIRFVNDRKIKNLILLGIFSGLSYLTNNIGIVVYPMVLITFLYLVFSKQTSIRSFFKNMIIFITTSFVSGGWYGIIFIITHGPLESSKSPSFWFSTFGENYNLIVTRIFNRLWTELGWYAINISEEYMLVIQYMTIISAAGVFLILTKRNSLIKIKLEKNHIVILFTSFGLALTIAVVFLNIVGDADGRYIFSAISSFAILLSLGLYVFVDKGKMKLLLLFSLTLLILLNISLVTDMTEKYNHGFKLRRDIDPFEKILIIYDNNLSLQNSYPEVKENDFSRIITLSEKNKIKENEVLDGDIHQIDLLKIYYSRQDLQTKFPEVKNNHNLKNLFQWAVKTGTEEKVISKTERDYFCILIKEC
jgi:hypothetical protein